MTEARTSSRAEFLKVWGPVLVLTVLGFVLALRLVGAPPPERLRLATGDPSGVYHAAGLAFRDALARSGVEVQVVETGGSTENLELLRSGAVDAAFVQGGTAAAGDEERLRAVASLAHEPLWVFTREGEATSLLELAGGRLQIGAAGSGTRTLALELLAACGLEPGRDFVDLDAGPEGALAALRAGEADALFWVTSARSPLVRTAFDDPALHALALERNAAYEHHFPHIVPVTLDRGGLDLAADLPRTPVPLLSTTAALVVPEEHHPALAPLWIEAAREQLSGPDPVTLAHTFPGRAGLDLPLARSAEAFFQNGRSFLYRLLPFQVAATVDRLKILLLPLVTLLLPLMRVAPPVYRWRIRRRIFLWYRDVMTVEARALGGEEPAALAAGLAELDREISQVEVPLSYAEELYHLRLHIQFVREGLERRAAAA